MRSRGFVGDTRADEQILQPPRKMPPGRKIKCEGSLRTGRCESRKFSEWQGLRPPRCWELGARIDNSWEHQRRVRPFASQRLLSVVATRWRQVGTTEDKVRRTLLGPVCQLINLLLLWEWTRGFTPEITIVLIYPTSRILCGTVHMMAEPPAKRHRSSGAAHTTESAAESVGVEFGD